MRGTPTFVDSQTLTPGTPFAFKLREAIASMRGYVLLALYVTLAGRINNAGAQVSFTERQFMDLLTLLQWQGPSSVPGVQSNVGGYHLFDAAQSLGWGPESTSRVVPNASNLDFRQGYIIPFAKPVALDSRGVRDTGIAAGDCPDTLNITVASAAILAAIDADLTWNANPTVRVSAILGHPRDGYRVGQPLAIQEMSGITQGINATPDGVILRALLDFDSAQSTTNQVTGLTIAGANRGQGILYDEMRRLQLESMGPMSIAEEQVPTFIAGETSRCVPLAWQSLGQRISDVPTGPVKYQLGTAASHTLVTTYIPPWAPEGAVAGAVNARAVQIARKENGPPVIGASPVLEGPYDGRTSVAHKVAWEAENEASAQKRGNRGDALTAEVSAGAPREA